MPKVEIVHDGATHNRKPLGEVGEVIEVDERTAKAMARYGLAKPVNEKADEPVSDETEDESSEPENSEPENETADDKSAAKRETRSGKPASDK